MIIGKKGNTTIKADISKNKKASKLSDKVFGKEWNGKNPDINNK